MDTCVRPSGAPYLHRFPIQLFQDAFQFSLDGLFRIALLLPSVITRPVIGQPYDIIHLNFPLSVFLIKASAVVNTSPHTTPHRSDVYKRQILLIAYICLIYGNSLMPAHISSRESGFLLMKLHDFCEMADLDSGWLTEHIVRKTAHFIEYTGLGILFLLYTSRCVEETGC